MSRDTNAIPVDEAVSGEADRRVRAEDNPLKARQVGQPFTQVSEFTQQFHSQCQQEGGRLPYELAEAPKTNDAAQLSRSARHRLGLSESNGRPDPKHKTFVKLKGSRESLLRMLQSCANRRPPNPVIDEFSKQELMAAHRVNEGKQKERGNHRSNGFDYGETRKMQHDQSFRSSRKDVHFVDIMAHSSKNRPSKQRQAKYKQSLKNSPLLMPVLSYKG